MEKDVKNQLASNPSHALPTVCDSKGTWWTAAAPASSHSDIMEFGALKMPEKAFSAVLGAGLGKKTSIRFAKLLTVDRIDRASVLRRDACERSNVAPCHVAPV